MTSGIDVVFFGYHAESIVEEPNKQLISQKRNTSVTLLQVAVAELRALINYLFMHSSHADIIAVEGTDR